MIDRRLAEAAPLATTWVTAAELHFGAAKSSAPEANREVVEAFLDTLPVLVPDRAAAHVFGETKTLLQQAGVSLADADLFIAALAIARGAPVITGNVRHFGRIPGLVVEDWMRGP